MIDVGRCRADHWQRKTDDERTAKQFTRGVYTDAFFELYLPDCVRAMCGTPCRTKSDFPCPGLRARVIRPFITKSTQFRHVALSGGTIYEISSESRERIRLHPSLRLPMSARIIYLTNRIIALKLHAPAHDHEESRVAVVRLTRFKTENVSWQFGRQDREIISESHSRRTSTEMKYQRYILHRRGREIPR